jgi:hypothetical protein
MKNYLTILLFIICFSSCNLGHPKKTNKVIKSSALVGTWTYRNEDKLILDFGGTGIQFFESKEFPITWDLTTNNHINLKAIRTKTGTMVEVKDVKFIISEDYREHFYFFGSLDEDFDNYEIWKKTQ